MDIQNYSHALKNLEVDKKLISDKVHKLEVREDQFKSFYRSNELLNINKELFTENFNLSELLSYERKLQIGEDGN